MNMACRQISRLCSLKAALLADQRGAVALELPAVYAFLLLGMLLPLADLAIAGFQYVSARGALRSFGQSIQYTPPSDLTNWSAWAAAVSAKADPRFPIPDLQVKCGDGNAVCSSANTASPKYYSYSTTVTLTPIVLTSVLCTSGTGNGCTFTLPHSVRFQ